MDRRFPLGEVGSKRWFISQQVALAILMGLNAYLLWHNWSLSVQFDVLLHGAQHIYNYATDRCFGRGA